MSAQEKELYPTLLELVQAIGWYDPESCIGSEAHTKAQRVLAEYERRTQASDPHEGQ